MKGLIRTARVNSQFATDLVPVDIPINLMIVAAWDRAFDTYEINSFIAFN